ncbi:MAG: hypothetical protein U5N58_08025 [Actinomycetota bacterium]|nr:hypothetical protein [Actinomycetota bacterium]
MQRNAALNLLPASQLIPVMFLTYISPDGNQWELRLNFEQSGDYFSVFSGVARRILC